jgi:hypothetical protein
VRFPGAESQTKSALSRPSLPRFTIAWRSVIFNPMISTSRAIPELRQQFLNRLPEPHGHRSLRPSFSNELLLESSGVKPVHVYA